MKIRQAAIFVICILSIFLIVSIANLSINAAAAATGQVALTILKPPTPKTICGDSICAAGENCPADCLPKEEIRKSISQIKFTYFIFIILIMILCTLSYLYLKEDRPPITSYWRYYGR